METLFQELKRYVDWSARDEQALLALHPHAVPEMERIASVFYDRILTNEGARSVLVGGESRVGQLKITLKAWMDKLLRGPWDEEYYELRCRIGRVHVRIAMPQHYMFGAMNVLRREINQIIDIRYEGRPELRDARVALGKILDLELAIMLHTYREDLEAQQARNERLATFGQLIGSIGHELRNPLGVIESSIYILQGRIHGDERAQKHIDRISEQLKISNGIISALLDMIRDRPLVPEAVRVSTLLESVLGSLSVPPDIAVEVVGIEELPPLQGDAGQLRQVLLNLVDNALHAASPTGRIQVHGRVIDGEIEIAVEDSGPGVTTETLRRLFEPLITTKTKGIGLGLALVKRIVERHRGSVKYAPRNGGGARFVVRLPGGQRA